jgi:adenylyl-sulfate kinase
MGTPPDPTAPAVDLLRLAVVGSVDDGKSTLIGRLLVDCEVVCQDHWAALQADSRRLNRPEADLAFLTDGLKAEREQGITIDVAYRTFSTPKRRFLLADTPGHEQYTRNMVTGASTADLAVLLLDAQRGLTTQSKRHGFLASLLGVPHLVVAVNKMDAVGYSEAAFREIGEQYKSFAARLHISSLTCIPLSALRGDNVVAQSARMPWYGGPTLLDYMESLYIGSVRNLVDFRFPIQLVLRPGPHFRGYAGTVLSGLSGSGKSTIASELRTRLLQRGCPCYVLDGDILRQGLNRDLGFCREDRVENIRRTAEVARLMNEAGVTVIVALISPFRQERAAAKTTIGSDRFLEVFVDAPLEVCESRDPKGLYARARRGEVPEFTGISSPYEPPTAPNVHLRTATMSPKESVRQVMDRLEWKDGVGS